MIAIFTKKKKMPAIQLKAQKATRIPTTATAVMATAWVKVMGVLPCLRFHVFAHDPNATFPPWSPKRHCGNGGARLLAEPGLMGEDFCRRYAAEADAWLSGLAERAAGENKRHLALLAVGGYGRRSLCPYSDLDVVLVHNGHRDIKSVADAIWYPVWDEGVHLDHSVRQPAEVLTAAAEDVRVALGLLDGRLVWGEPKVADPLLEKARAAWRERLGTKYLPLLEVQMAERRKTAGDVAFLLEPDLKESHGGLRDVSVLRAISAYAPLLADYADLASLERRGGTAHRRSGSSCTAWPSASTTSCCSRTRTRWPPRSASPTPMPSCWPSRPPGARSPG